MNNVETQIEQVLHVEERVLVGVFLQEHVIWNIVRHGKERHLQDDHGQ